MSQKGSLHGHFQRALERRQLLAAEAAARQLGRLSVADALAFTLLLAEQAPERFDRAAARWHARFVLEARELSLAESQLALGAVAALGRPGAAGAAAALVQLAQRHRVPNVEAVLRALGT